MQDRLPDRKPPANGTHLSAPTPDRTPLLSRRGLGIFGALGIVALIAAGYAYWRHETLYPSTDNAQIAANIIQIAPLVTGVVTEVRVQEYASVKSGDVLLQIDPAPFEAALKLAEGRLAVAQQQAQGAPGAQAAAAKGNVEQAQAAVAQARTELDHATIKAPVDGTVGKVRIRPGDIAKAGMSIFPLVDTSTWWVDANFKETDLARIKPGQAATVFLDIYPSKELTGKVEAISRASSSSFSLLPSENATGSWVKVVQRFPVRIALTLDADDPPMGVGASASVTIDTSSDGVASGTK
ncbi:HlyD family secretion protein [Hyphomicrobium sp.]|uniref:HlyD family secretion protein n=1 Tax=Hyphomicrobium sp. TaxID=82 RepID=UPI003563B8CA